MPEISVIIPCFNHGEYIEESIRSVLTQTCQDFEIIVIDDGSTDEKTKNIIDNLNFPKITIIKTENNGLPAARNIAISKSTGKYILPLDADDKIGKRYLEKAFEVLESNSNVGIVYCKAKLFGAVEKSWVLPEFDIKIMLEKNIIFASAFFRKSDWELVGGYKKDMLYGYEDYDLWLSILELGREVYSIPETLFYYRKYKKNKSMFKKIDYKKRKYSYDIIYKRHYQLYQQHIDVLFEIISDLKNKIIKEKEKKSNRIDRKLKRLIKGIFICQK